MSQSRRIPAFLHDNGLLLACLGLFVVFFVGMVVSGAATYNQEQQEHGSQEQVSVLTYLTWKRRLRTGSLSSCRWACMSC